MATVRSFTYGIIFATCLVLAPGSIAQEPSANTTTPPPSATISIRVQQIIAESQQSLDNGDLDNALASVDSALQLDPHNASLYELRGSIYIKKKLWDRAENDYQSALQIDPTATSFKYKLAEIKFLQKAYAAARPGFLALESDPGLGELAKYKVFLCDLFGYQEAIARQELDALNKAPEKHQSYYFCNAVWDLYHQNRQGANKWIVAASHLYSSSEMDLYLSNLKQSDSLSAPIISFTTKQGVTYTNAKVFVESNGLRISSTKGWLTVSFDQLPSDLSDFPADLRKEIEVKENPSPAAKIDTEVLSFSTKGGKKYDRVKWSVEDDGLRVLTSDGWITVPFDQLPGDLSSFPAEVQTQIALKHKAALDKAIAAPHPPPDNDPDIVPAIESPAINIVPPRILPI